MPPALFFCAITSITQSNKTIVNLPKATLAAAMATLTAVPTTARAQLWQTQWMSHPTADDTSAVCFRRTIILSGRPRHAEATVATTGRTVLYVNGRNVSTSLFMPQRQEGDTSAVAVTLDITHLMRPDTNTVAVLYCPSTATRRQVAVGIYGTQADGQPLAACSPLEWMCRKASLSITHNGGETYDATMTLPGWTYSQPLPTALWLPACTYQQPQGGDAVSFLGPAAEDVCGYSPLSPNPTTDSAARPYAILRPRYSDTAPGYAAYHFAPGFCGMARVTLRGCRRGEMLHINNLTYICSGDTDEQAFCRFTTHYARKVVVTGDSSFTPSQVQDVEAICF